MHFINFAQQCIIDSENYCRFERKIVLKTDVMAYYFPNWHVDPQNEKWHGKGWTEWEVLKSAQPKFPGHIQPKIPIWGYLDESKPENMEIKIEAAKEHSVDGFIFDWYWYNAGSYRIKCIEEGFLKARNCQDVKFALMWANHPPIYVHPANRRDVINKTTDLFNDDKKITRKTFIEATNHVIEHYFCKSNYYILDGGLYFSFFCPNELIDSFGGIDGCKKMLDDFRDRASKCGYDNLNLVGNANAFPGDTVEEKMITAKKAGFNSVSYHNFGTRDNVSEFPHCDYNIMCSNYLNKISGDIIDARKVDGLNYYITASQGNDASPRTVPSEAYEDIGSPFLPICTNNTPENFKKHLRDLKSFADKNKIPLITVYAWNEWTEGGCLEPDEYYKFAYLEAIHDVFGNKNK